jgi:hypothetical protein
MRKPLRAARTTMTRPVRPPRRLVNSTPRKWLYRTEGTVMAKAANSANLHTPRPSEKRRPPP